MARTKRTYELITCLGENGIQMFLKKCHKKLADFLKERVCQGIDKLAVPANHYIDVQGMVNFGKSK